MQDDNETSELDKRIDALVEALNESKQELLTEGEEHRTL